MKFGMCKIKHTDWHLNVHFCCGGSKCCIFDDGALFSEGAVCIAGDSISTEWKTKFVRQWMSSDIMCWIISVANDYGLKSEDISVRHFNDIDGTTLYKMSEAEFVSRESQYGKRLYHKLQELKQEQDQQMAYNLNKREFFQVHFM
jgi:hypothetical protein